MWGLAEKLTDRPVVPSEASSGPFGAANLSEHGVLLRLEDRVDVLLGEVDRDLFCFEQTLEDSSSKKTTMQ